LCGPDLAGAGRCPGERRDSRPTVRQNYRLGTERHALETALAALGHPKTYEFVAVRN
jgi:hypothetical protein